MTQTLIGIGRLLVSGVAHPCRYHVDVYQRRGSTKGVGFLIGSTELLASARDTSNCVLRLEDGRSCRVVVTSHHEGNSDAAIALTGDLDGVGALQDAGVSRLQ